MHNVLPPCSEFKHSSNKTFIQILCCRKVFLSGHSAGAHLCAMVFASTWFGDLPKVDKNLFGGVFYFAGIYDLRPLLTTTYNDPLGLDENSVIEVSPMLLVEKMSSNFKCEEILMKRCKFKVKVRYGPDLE